MRRFTKEQNSILKKRKRRMNKIPQNQRSDQWLNWRRQRIGASEASAIMGTNSFKSIGQLFDEKLGLRSPDEENEAMRRGNDLEDDARCSFELNTGYVMFPQVCVHPEYLWMIASMDGLTIEKDVGVEIKCPGPKVAFDIYHKKVIPEYYYPQLQHQMAVTGLDKMYFYSYVPDNNESNSTWSTIIICPRNDDYIKKMIEKEKRFYEILMQGFKQIEENEDKLYALKDEVYKILEDS